MQFLGGRRTAYIFIATDVRITFDRAGTVDSLVICDVGIASNRRIVQIRVTGYVEVRRIRCAVDGLVAGRMGITVYGLVPVDGLIALDMGIFVDGKIIVRRAIRIRGLRDLDGAVGATERCRLADGSGIRRGLPVADMHQAPRLCTRSD